MDTSIQPVTLDEIINNLSARNSTGRNIIGRGIRGDIEEYLGWHLRDIKKSPLSELDRVNSLEKIRNTDFLQTSEMAQSDLKEFLDKKIDELSRKEGQKYLSSRSRNSDLSESEGVKRICEELSFLEKEYEEKVPGTQKWPAGVPRTGRATEVDRIADQIKELEISLGKLLFQKQRDENN